MANGAERSLRTVYLVVPVTYDAEQADDDCVAQELDAVVRNAAAREALERCGVESVGHCVVQPRGDEVPLGIE